MCGWNSCQPGLRIHLPIVPPSVIRLKPSNQSVLWQKKTTLSKTKMKGPPRRVRPLPRRRSTRDRRALHRQAGRTPSLLARKVRPRRKKSHQNVLRQKERPSRPMKRSVFALTSFRNAGIDLRCLATRVPIGSKPSDSSSPKQVLAESVLTRTSGSITPFLRRSCHPRFICLVTEVIPFLERTL
jgi:hypothetical protein